jgi:hypothetical protein
MSVDFQKVMRISVERNDIVQFILLFNVLNCSLSTQRYARRVCVSVCGSNRYYVLLVPRLTCVGFSK